MSRYLEEAARVLKTAEAHADEKLFAEKKNRALMDVASGFATLAAIDKGLMPAEMIADILRAMPTGGAL